MNNILLNTSIVEHIATMEVSTEEGMEWVLKYHLLTMQGVADEVFYALSIDKCTSSGEVIESETTFAFTEDYNTAKTMAEAFAECIVFPVTVNEMVDEWFAKDI